MEERFIALDSNVLFLISALMYDEQNVELYADFENNTFDRKKYLEMPFEKLPQIFRRQLLLGKKNSIENGINTAVVRDAYRLKQIFFDKKNNYRLIILPAVLKEVNQNSISANMFMKRHCKVLKFHDEEHEELFKDLADALTSEYIKRNCFDIKDVADARIMAEASILGIDNLLTFNKIHFIYDHGENKKDIRKEISQINQEFFAVNSHLLNTGTLSCSPTTPQEFIFDYVRKYYSIGKNSLVEKEPQFYSYTSFSNSTKTQNRIKQKSTKYKKHDKVTLRHHYSDLDYTRVKKDQKLNNIRKKKQKKNDRYR